MTNKKESQEYTDEMLYGDGEKEELSGEEYTTKEIKKEMQAEADEDLTNCLARQKQKERLKTSHSQEDDIEMIIEFNTSGSRMHFIKRSYGLE